MLSEKELDLICEGVHYPTFTDPGHGQLRVKTETGGTALLTYVQLTMSSQPCLAIICHYDWVLSNFLYQIVVFSSDHLYHNKLLFLKLNLTWTNKLSLSLHLWSGMNSPSL